MGIFQNLKKTVSELVNKKTYFGLFYDNGLDSANKWGASEFLRANELSLYLNRAIEKRAEKVGEIVFTLSRGGKLIEKDPLLNLLQKPNELQTGRQFWALCQKYKDLTGSAFILIEREGEIFNTKPKSLKLLRPDLVTINFENDSIKNYTYKKPDGGEATFLPSQIIYLYNPNPIRPFLGVSLVQAGIMAIDTGIQIEKYQSKIIRNGGKVEGVFKFKTPSLTKQQVADLKDVYAQQMADAKNSGKPLFMGGDMEYQKLGLNPEELSYIATKGVILDDICMLTGVPRTILSNVTDVKYSNADASIAVFLRETIKPLLEQLTETLDWRFIPKDLDLGFIDPTPQNTEEKLKVVENGIKYHYITPNEARAVMGYEPITNGDELLIPFNLMPATAEPQENKAITKAEDIPPVEVPAEATKHPLADEAKRKAYAVKVVAQMDKGEAKFKKALTTLFNGQLKRVVAGLGLKGKGVITKDVLDGLNIELEVNLTKDKFLPILKQILINAGESTALLIGSDFTFSSALEAWLDQRVNFFAEEITNTTFNKIKAVIEENVAGGATRDETVKALTELYQGFNKTRAITIARTEVHGATTNGNFEAYKQGGVQTKIWVTVLDGATRPSHIAVDGEEQAIDVPFTNGLMYPSDPSAPAEEVINCRCVI